MTNGKNKDEKEKVTLGQEKFEAPLPLKEEEVQADKKLAKDLQEEKKKNVVEPDQVLVKKEEKSMAFKKPKKGQMYALVAALVLILVLLSETIRRSVFRAEDSLIFVPKGGMLIPPVGTAMIAAALILLIIASISLFNKRGKLTGQQKGIAILVSILIAFIGFTSYFRYVDFTETKLIDRSIFANRESTYLDVTEVHASTKQEGENNVLYYHYKLLSGRDYELKVTEKNKDEVKLIDTKIKNTAKRSIDNYAIQEMERLGMYTKDEALNLFILE
ncbi:hypothetical protein [Proteiniclasticum ruminis]|uniref:Uncharacterized protein n=1 Tax=Proteiniclasticum ruminis TaxID=398199 RepID=A0A1I5AIU7_9CLOT|nr:hypothetical protein [Proteiniclasticum ruminis]SFN62367.1 hypothetical protein SAMN04488695_10347 [Proteiniclasticum ruminis]